MLYKRPIIALTSLLDLLFILIFAYQMDIKTNADEYVQAEINKRVPQNIPDQKELIAELQVENQRVKNELEIVRKKAESIDEYKLQLEEYKAQRDQLSNALMSVSVTNITKNVLNDKFQSEDHRQKVVELRNALKKKERELVTVKQENERIKKQSKPEGVIPITKEDAELTKMLVGTWKEYCDYFGWRNSKSPTQRKTAVSSVECVFNGDGKYSESGTFKALLNDMVLNNTIVVRKGQSSPYTNEGTWWIKDGCLYVRTDNNISGMEILFIKQHEYKMRDDRRLAVGVRVK